MATGGIKEENEKAAEIESDLATVKRVTQQVRSFGFLNLENPIYQWMLDNNDSLLSGPFASDLFPMDHGDWIGQLKLTCADGPFQLSLCLTDPDTGEAMDPFDPFRFFVCKFRLYFYDEIESYEKCFFSMNAFSWNGEKKELNFRFYHGLPETITVELFQEPLAMIQYRSPFKDTVVGKIERFLGMNEGTNYKAFIAASPRFTFGPSGQLAIVTFRRRHFRTIYGASGLSATLHVLSEGQGPLLSFAATLTIFSQKENEKDLVGQVEFRLDEDNTDFLTLLVFHRQINSYLENDTLYYKVDIKPRPIQLKPFK